jgi:hypothetical protein
MGRAPPGCVRVSSSAFLWSTWFRFGCCSLSTVLTSNHTQPQTHHSRGFDLPCLVVAPSNLQLAGLHHPGEQQE